MDDDENKKNSDREFLENLLLEFIKDFILLLIGILLDWLLKK